MSVEMHHALASASPTEIDLDFRRDILRGCDATMEGFRTLVEKLLPGFANNRIGFVVAEVLQAYQRNGLSFTHIYSSHQNDRQREEFKKEYFKMIKALPRPMPKWSLSNSHQLYFGEGSTHRIFCGCIKDETAQRSVPESVQMAAWNGRRFSHRLGRDYSQTYRVDSTRTDIFWRAYQSAFNELRKTIDQSSYFYNILIPVSFNGSERFDLTKKPIGAVFLAIGSQDPIQAAEFAGLYLTIQAFWHYHYSAEAIDTLFSRDKYRQMMELIEAPLERISNALGSIHTNAQELRAVLYDPAKALFGSHQHLGDLFREDELLTVSRHIKVRISHSNNYGSTDNDNDDYGHDRRRGSQTDGQVVLAVALCRIFGRTEKLKTFKSRKSLLAEVRKILTRLDGKDEREGEQSFEDMVDGTKFLFDSSHIALGRLLDGDVSNRLKVLKKALFDPYKVHAEDWSARSLQLAVRGYLENRDAVCEKVLKDINDTFKVSSLWTPAGYHTILNFVTEVAGECYHRKEPCKIDRIEVKKDGGKGPNQSSTWKALVIYFSSSYVTSNDGLVQARALINKHVLKHPRDWRLTETQAGNFRKPFIDLASHLLGVSESEAAGWCPVPVHKLLNEKSMRDVFAVYREARLFRVVVTPFVESNGSSMLAIIWEPCPKGRIKLQQPMGYENISQGLS